MPRQKTRLCSSSVEITHTDGSFTPGPGSASPSVQSPSELLARRRVAERDVRVQRRVLEARRRLDRGDDLPRHAELGEAAERRLLVGAEVADRLVEADQPLLDQVLGVAAGEEVRARLEPDEARVAADQLVEGRRRRCAPDDELQILELSLSLLRRCGSSVRLGRASASPSVSVRAMPPASSHPQVEEKIARTARQFTRDLQIGPALTGPLRRGAAARAVRASLRRARSRSCERFVRAWPGSSSSSHEGRELSFCTSWPDVPRTAESDETRQTRSLPRCSAASRSSSASACAAKRTSSGPSSCPRPTPSKTSTPRAPRRRRSPRAGRPARAGPRSRRVQQVVAVEEVEGRVRHRAAAAPRRAARRGDADVQRLDLARERDRDRGVAGPPHERPQAPALGAEDERDAAARGRPPTSASPPRRPRPRPRARRP